MQVENLVNEVLLKHKQSIPMRDYDSINNYLTHGEWGLAFELLCAVFEQDKIGITLADYEKLVTLGTYFEYESMLWERFRIVD